MAVRVELSNVQIIRNVTAKQYDLIVYFLNVSSHLIDFYVIIYRYQCIEWAMTKLKHPHNQIEFNKQKNTIFIFLKPFIVYNLS